MHKLDAQSGLGALKAAAEPTRLRMLFLLADCELTVKDLTIVLGQSQPRISRHLKLLTEAGLIERNREGSSVYFRLARENALGSQIITSLRCNDPFFTRDRERLTNLAKQRAADAQAYFARNAADWDRLRSLYVDDAEVEAAMLRLLGNRNFRMLVDLGTGTGRMLQAFAGRYEQALGIDTNKEMLGYARSKLDGLASVAVQVRQGDLYNLSINDEAADFVVMHQVLHYLTDPPAALIEANRILSNDGLLLIVDFAPHDLEFLQHDYAHHRLGFSDVLMRQWLKDAGLAVTEQINLEPLGDDDEQLTVSMWTAARPTARQREAIVSKENQNLEAAR